MGFIHNPLETMVENIKFRIKSTLKLNNLSGNNQNVGVRTIKKSK